MSKSGTYHAVYIEWIDSVMKLPVWWSSQKMIDETTEPKDVMQTVSYLINQNKKEYILSSSIHFDETGVVNFGQIFSIPKGCVTKLIKLKINEHRTR